MAKKGEMTLKQRKFCDEYLKSGNMADAARRAGYSPRSAEKQGQENLQKPLLRAYIDAQLDALHKSTIMEADEVLQRLTALARGEEMSEVVVVEGVGDGCSEARRMDKLPDARERLKALELLGRRYGLFTDRTSVDVSQPVVIVGDDRIAD